MLHEYCLHTGLQFRVWLLYFALLVLVGILPVPYLQHFAMLVAAIHVYTCNSIKCEDLVYAEQLMETFCRSYEELYGMQWNTDHIMANATYCHSFLGSLTYTLCTLYSCVLLYVGVKRCTMNIHLLRHLGGCVRSWGPLWAYSTFPFENVNGHLKALFHGTKDMSKQVYTYYTFRAIII